MTTSVNDDEDPTPEKIVADTRANIFPFDPSLESLDMYINLLDKTEVGITLHVKGAVVSGLLISSRSYFKQLVWMLDGEADNSPDPEKSGAKAFAHFYRTTLEEMEAEMDRYRKTDELPRRPHHIHLREAQTFLAGSAPLLQKLWRGRLTEVDAWSIGHFGESIPPLPEEMQ